MRGGAGGGGRGEMGEWTAGRSNMQRLTSRERELLGKAVHMELLHCLAEAARNLTRIELSSRRSDISIFTDYFSRFS